MRRILVLSGLVVALAAAVGVPGAAATTGLSSRYAVAGVETPFPTATTGTFAGLALGSSGDGATWTATVDHQDLSNCPFGSGLSCTITGGTFALQSLDGAQLAGSFMNGGSVTPASQQAGCGKQVFAVSGTLATTSGTASFTATLTHYRVFFGRCITYFASIKGSLQLA
jgi:hypothetical protein